MRSKIKAIIFSISLLISILSVSVITSCFAPEGEKIDVTPPQDLEQDIEELEDEYVLVDYENAEIGAEMSGYIPSFLCTDSDNYIKIEIKNTSDFTWRANGENRVRVSYHYYGQDVDFVDYDGTQRTVLPKEVSPGESITLLMLINDITNPGIYIIQIDPVLEGNEIPENNFWFSSKGVEMIQGQVFFDECGTN